MRKTRRRKKKKDASLRVSLYIITILSLAIAPFLFLSLSLSLTHAFSAFRLPFFSGFTLVESLRPVSGDAGHAADCCPPSSHPLLSPLRPLNQSAQLLLLLCLAFLPLPFFFVWSVTIITLVTFFLVYTSLYLVKFSKFTIKITCGFFCQSSGDNLALCNKYTICTLAN